MTRTEALQLLVHELDALANEANDFAARLAGLQRKTVGLLAREASAPDTSPGIEPTDTAPEANDPVAIVKGHMETIRREEEAARFTDGTVATPQELPFPATPSWRR